MKKLSIVISLLCLTIIGIEKGSANCNKAFNLQEKSQIINNPTHLSRAFEKISDLPNFHTIPKSELKGMYPKELGNVKCVICANAHSRPEVLQILKEIPFELLYSEYRTDRDKITRCYIEKDANGDAHMLAAIVGWGGNDLVVTYFSDANIDLYQKEGDKLKENSFEEIEECVTNVNAECPIVIGPNSEITSMSINRKYWTVRMKINTNGVGFEKDINNEAGKKRAMTMLKAFEKSQISKLFNLRISLKAIITIESRESYTFILEPNDIASILNDTDTTPEQALTEYVEMNKNACPIKIEKGMYMSDIKYENNVLTTIFSMDETEYSIDQLKENSKILRAINENIIRLNQDKMEVMVAKWLVALNSDKEIIYKGNTTEKSVSILFTADQLRQFLIGETDIIDTDIAYEVDSAAVDSLDAYVNMDYFDVDPKQAIEDYIQNIKDACPLDMGDGMLVTDIKFVGNILIHEVTVDEVDEPVSSMKDPAAVAVIRAALSASICDVSEDDNMMHLVALWLIETNRGMGFEYKGKISKETVKVYFTCSELRKILKK